MTDAASYNQGWWDALAAVTEGTVIALAAIDDTCSNCRGSGMDSTLHFEDQPAEPHPCGFCHGGTYSGRMAQS